MAVIGAHLSKLDWVRNRKKIFICGFCVEQNSSLCCVCKVVFWGEEHIKIILKNAGKFCWKCSILYYIQKDVKAKVIV